MHINPADESAYIISTQQYDWKGRPTISTHQDGTTRSVSYAGCGCAGQDEVTSTDEMGRKQKAYYDVFGRVTRTEILNASNTVYSSRVPVYNVRDQVTEGRLIEGTNGSAQITTLEYDGYGRLLKQCLPVEGANSPGTRYAYYKNDIVQSVTDPRNVVATYACNARNLVTSVIYNEAGVAEATADLTFAYNQNGSRTLMIESGFGQTAYNYDNLGWLASETRTFNAVGSFTMSYDYNLAGNLTRITDAFNDSVYYTHDRVGRISTVTGSAYQGVTAVCGERKISRLG
jgi:YD repeat-containing protein